MGGRSRRTVATGARMGVFVPLAVGVLAGCGQRGPLTLPSRDVETPPVAESTPQPVSETQAENGERESDEDEG